METCTHNNHLVKVIAKFFTHTPVFPLKVRLAPGKSCNCAMDVRYNAPPPIPDPLLPIKWMFPCTSVMVARALNIRYKVLITPTSISKYGDSPRDSWDATTYSHIFL